MAVTRPQVRHGAMGAVTYVENDPPMVVCDSIALTDDDSAVLTGATARISRGYEPGHDLLSCAGAPGGISAAWDPLTGTLTLSGTASLADYEIALRSVTFVHAGDDPQEKKRKVSFQVDDGTSPSRETAVGFKVTPFDDLPVLTVTPVLVYTSLQAPVAIDGALALVDPDSEVRGATVSISANYQPGEDVLTWQDTANVEGSFDEATGTLKLRGKATAAEYQQVLRSVSYTDLEAAPTLVPRTITIQVDETTRGADGPVSVTANITVAYSGAPQVGVEGTPVLYTEGDPAVTLEPALVLGDIDDPTLAGATVSIVAGFATGDTLLFTNTANISGSYDAGTGVLTLAGTAGVAEYQAALRSIQFANTTEDPGADKTIAWVVSDGTDDSAPVTTAIDVTPVNDAPVFSMTATLAYTENDPPAAIAPAATVSDADSADFNGGSLTVAFTANGTSADQLTIVHQGTGAGQVGVSGSSITYGGAAIGTFTGGTNGSALVVTFSGSAATPAAVQALVRDIAFGNTSDNPSALSRTVNFTLADGDGGAGSASAGATVNVTSVNDAPTATASSGAAGYTEGGGAVAIDPSFAAGDPDNATLAGATVQVTGNYLNGSDVLAFTNAAGMGNIAGTFDASTGTLTLASSGATATVAQWQAALAAVTFDTGSASPGASRTISFQLDDGQAANNLSAVATRAIAITEVNSAPVVTATGGSAAFVENAPAAAVDGGISVTDSDTSTLLGATAQVTVNFNGAQDVLSFTPVGNITGSFDATTGVLTLTGTDTLANYEAALASVRYDNTSDTPDTATRTIGFQVDDGQGTGNLSAVATRTVTVAAANDAPVVAAGTTLSYTENDAATVIASTATVADADSADFNGGSLTAAFTANGTTDDQLAIVNQGAGAGQVGVSGADVTYGGTAIGTWSGGTNGSSLVVAFNSASATPAAVQALVRAIGFSNTSESPSPAARTVTFTVVDGDGGSDSGSATATVNVASVNDAPVLANGAGTALAYTENDAATLANSSLTIADSDSPNLTGATVAISSNFHSGEDVLSFTAAGAITGSFDASTGVLTLSGTDTAANYQSAIDSVKYRNTSENPAAATRTLSFQVDDGAAANHASNVVTRDITVTPVNDAPAVTAGGTLAYTENDAASVIDGTVTASDAEGDSLTGAHVTLSTNFQAGQDVLSFTPTASISGIFNSSTGVLTLSGTDTTANYQAALRSVRYTNSSENPATATRTILFDATDSHGDTGAAATATVTVASVNDAPVNTVPADASVGTAFSNTAMSIGGLSIADVDAGSATMTVHVTVASGGATFSLAGGATVSAGANGSGDVTLGGTVSQLNAALATLSYKSNDGFTGSDTITVVTSDGGNTGGGGTKTDTDVFHVGVVPQVFIIDNTDATADSASAGSAANPFNSVAAFSTFAADGTGDYVYVMKGTGTYSEASGFTLGNNEQVYGQGQTLQFTNPVTGEVVTVGTGSGADTPVISITGASQAGVTLAQGNTLKGFDIATTLGSQTGIVDGGGTVGSLTVADVNVTGTGMAVDIDQGGALAVAIDKLVSSGSAQQGLQLAGSLTGSFTVTDNTSAISGSTGTGLLVGDGSGTANTGGTFSLGYAGSIATTGTARALDIEDRSAGAGNVTLSGAISHSGGNANGIFIDDIAGGAITLSGSNTLNTGTSAAVLVTDVTGGGVTFSGSQDIDTTSGTGVSASNVVALVMTGSGSTVATTNGTAVNLANTAIGASGLNFASISASGGVNGIVLANTGSAGSLVVTGSGTANSGGTISGTTGDGISVTSGAIQLAYMLVQNAAGNGIGLSNLLRTDNTFNNGTITGFDNGGANSEDGIHWVNTGSNSGSLTLSNSTVSGGASGNDGIFVEAQGSGALALTVSDSAFTGLFGDGIQANGITGATSVVRLTIQNSSFQDAVASTGNGGLSINPFGDVTLFADIDGNQFGSILNPVTTLGAIGITNGGTADADITVRNNTLTGIAGGRGITVTADGGTTDLLIDNNSVDDLGSTSKAAINVNFTNNSTLGTAASGNVTVSNNEIGQNGSVAGNLWTSGNGTANAILLQALNGGSMTAAVTGNVVDANTTSVIEVVRLRAASTTGFGGGTIDATVTGNDLQDTETTTHVEFDATAGTSTLAGTVNLSIAGNTVPGSGVGVIKLTENAAGTIGVTQASSAAVSSANGSATVTVTGTPTYGAASPPSPSTPALPLLAIGAVDGTADAPSITAQDLASIVEAAANRWSALPLSQGQLHALSGLAFTVGELSGGAVGTQAGGLVVLDDDAGGLGWFVDATPMDDVEFAGQLAGNAASHVDLLTAVMHEMGHALGLGDLYGTADSADVMYGYIEAGERRLPCADDLCVTLVGTVCEGGGGA